MKTGNTFVLMLLLISAGVAVGLWMKMNMWIAIAGYWTVLAIKNLYDYTRRNK